MSGKKMGRVLAFVFGISQFSAVIKVNHINELAILFSQEFPDGGVVSGHDFENLFGQSAAPVFGQVAGFFQFFKYPLPVIRVANNDDVFIILGRSANQGWPADVGHLHDGVDVGVLLGNGFANRVKVYADQMKTLNAVFFELRFVFRSI